MLELEDFSWEKLEYSNKHPMLDQLRAKLNVASNNEYISSKHRPGVTST